MNTKSECDNYSVQLPLNPIHRQPRLERIMSLEIREEEEDTATEISAMRPGNDKFSK
jgi:hypothetical protein